MIFNPNVKKKDLILFTPFTTPAATAHCQYITLFQIVLKAKKIELFPANCFVIPASNFLLMTG